MQSTNNKNILFDAVKRLAIAKGGDITSERIQIYAEYLARFDLKTVMSALETLFKTNAHFPDISDIIKIVDPTPDNKDEANEMAGAIIESIGRFGPYQVSNVREYIGEDAWNVVEKFCGWDALCRTERVAEMGTMRAQLRDLCKAIGNLSNIKNILPPYKKERLGIGYDSFKKTELKLVENKSDNKNMDIKKVNDLLGQFLKA